MSAISTERVARAKGPSFMGVLHWFKERWEAITTFIVFIVIWELIVRFRNIPEFILPAPSVIYQTFLRDFDLLVLNSKATLIEIVVGYVLAVIFGISTAFFVVRFKFVERAIFPYLIGSQTVPKIAIAPLIIIWLGTGLIPKVVIVTVIAFFPICINTITGLRNAEQKYILLCQSVAASEAQIFRKVRFPYAIPYIFAGLKVATTLSVLGAVAAEWVGASEGLGYLILSGNYNFETARVFVGLIALFVLGTSFFGVVSFIEGLVSWRTLQIDTTEAV